MFRRLEDALFDVLQPPCHRDLGRTVLAESDFQGLLRGIARRGVLRCVQPMRAGATSVSSRCCSIAPN